MPRKEACAHGAECSSWQSREAKAAKYKVRLVKDEQGTKTVDAAAIRVLNSKDEKRGRLHGWPDADAANPGG